MPFALIFIGVMFLVVAWRDMETPFFQLVKNDFTGQGNFLYWIAALMIIGAIGYIPKAKPVSDALLVTILIALFLAAGRRGVFSELTAELATTGGGGAAAAAATAASTLTGGQ